VQWVVGTDSDDYDLAFQGPVVHSSVLHSSVLHGPVVDGSVFRSADDACPGGCVAVGAGVGAGAGRDRT